VTDMLSFQEQSTEHLCGKIADFMLNHQWMLATAESCTGGLIAGSCTSLAGSSAWFDRGFVTYSNHAKTSMLGVPEALISAHGAVSEPVARHGPRCTAVCLCAGGTLGHRHRRPRRRQCRQTGGHRLVRLGDCATGMERSPVFEGDRAAVRAATVRHSLQRLLTILQADT